MKKTEEAARGKSPEEIARRFEAAHGKLKQSFAQAFAEAKKQYGMLMATGSKGELNFCYISFLRSGVAVKLPLFRIDLYDENDRLDLTECAAPWGTGFLTDAIYTDIPMKLPPVPAKDDLTEWEIEALWLAEAEKYFMQMKAALGTITAPVRAQHPGVQFFYGEYMDAATRL